MTAIATLRSFTLIMTDSSLDISDDIQYSEHLKKEIHKIAQKMMDKGFIAFNSIQRFHVSIAYQGPSCCLGTPRYDYLIENGEFTLSNHCIEIAKKMIGSIPWFHRPRADMRLSMALSFEYK